MPQIYQSLDTFLREKGIKASYQRVRILDYMKSTKSHPSVAKIYEDLRDHIPSLSLATVYNTLNLFLEKRLVQEIKSDGDEARFDLIDYPHAHFQCEGCGEIYDVPMGNAQACVDLDGFEIHETQIFYRGLCSHCLHSHN